MKTKPRITLFFLCVLCAPCGKIFSQIDTITRFTIPPYVGGPQLNDGGDINLDRIGLVENKILYGSQTVDGNDVLRYIRR